MTTTDGPTVFVIDDDEQFIRTYWTYDSLKGTPKTSLSGAITTANEHVWTPGQK
jgi:hypothetical protein